MSAPMSGETEEPACRCDRRDHEHRPECPAHCPEDYEPVSPPARGPATATPMTAVVRCGGRDLDDLGPPSDGHYYLVLEVPNGHSDLIQAALTTWRIGLVEAQP